MGSVFNEDYNKGAIEFFQFILSGYLALLAKDNPGQKEFLFFAAIFVSLWARKNWFGEYHELAFLNLGLGFSMAMAWIAQVTNRGDDFDGSTGNVFKWTLFTLFAIQWVILQSKKIVSSN